MSGATLHLRFDAKECAAVASALESVIDAGESLPDEIPRELADAIPAAKTALDKWKRLVAAGDGTIGCER